MGTYNKKKLVVVSSAPLIQTQDGTFLYKPYETEMQIWSKHVDFISFCCPIWKEDRNLLKSEVSFDIDQIIALKDFNLKNSRNFICAISATIFNTKQIFKAMKTADHIHLRCPGNIGLIGCLVQILFPAKPKTAKYAGNWDPKSKQPITYKIQKWILSNTFLTRNTQVLVYGGWKNQSKNIVPFFTATYAETDKKPVIIKDLKRTIDFVFVGALVVGKNPLYAIKLVEKLAQKGFYVKLTVFGEGIERDQLERYVALNDLAELVFFKGNQNQEIIKIAFQDSHFVVLPSKSEGWPKVIAEAMFWGCVPIATKVSCVPFMLDFGKRGILVEMHIESDSTAIENVLIDQNIYDTMQTNGAEWSRKYTMDFFESEIKKMIL